MTKIDIIGACVSKSCSITKPGFSTAFTVAFRVAGSTRWKLGQEIKRGENYKILGSGKHWDILWSYWHWRAKGRGNMGWFWTNAQRSEVLKHSFKSWWPKVSSTNAYFIINKWGRWFRAKLVRWWPENRDHDQPIWSLSIQEECPKMCNVWNKSTGWDLAFSLWNSLEKSTLLISELHTHIYSSLLHRPNFGPMFSKLQKIGSNGWWLVANGGVQNWDFPHFGHR